MPARISGFGVLPARVWAPKGTELWVGSLKHMTFDEVAAGYPRLRHTGQLRADGGSSQDTIYAPSGSVRSDYGLATLGFCAVQRLYEISNVWQLITAATDQIIRNFFVELRPNAAYVLTSTPTIPAGSNGEIVTVVRGDAIGNNVTLQDETVLAGTKLRLKGGVNAVLAQRTSITLRYSSLFSEWIELGRSF